MTMEKLWRKNLRDIEPYVPGEQSTEENIVKINANENPYPPSPKAFESMRHAASVHGDRQPLTFNF